MFLTRRLAPLLLVALVPAVLSVGCKRGAPPSPTPDSSATSTEKPIDVRFGKVEMRKLPRTLEVSGTLDADERSEVASQAAAVVTEIKVDVGSRVKKGDVLVLLDGRDASLRLASANAQTKQAMARLGIKPGEKFDADQVADVRAAKEAMDLAVSEAERSKALFDSGAISQSAWDQARSGAERARAAYDAAKNGAEQSWAGLIASQAQANLAQKSASDTQIRAPFDGAVVERRISAGEYASPGRVVVVVVRDNPLRLRIDVPEVDAGSVTMDSPVDLAVAAFPGKIFHGTIKRIGASLKVQSRALPVEAEVSNDEGKLRPGFFARAYIALGGDPAETLLVPKTAIGTSGSSSRVFVKSSDKVVERLVVTGREIDGLVEVKGPLEATDVVAIEGVDTLTDGASVVEK